jgi:hypothetical protein
VALSVLDCERRKRIDLILAQFRGAASQQSGHFVDVAGTANR